MKKLEYTMGTWALVIGLVIAIGVYIRDLHFGPIAKLVALTGLSIAFLGVIFLWVCYKNVVRYKNLRLELKTNELVLQMHGYQRKLSEKHLLAFLLIFLIVSALFTGYMRLNMQPVNRLNVVGSKAITINGTEVVMPFPMTVTIDDTGWRYSLRSDHSPHILEDYENLVYIGKHVGTRLMCAFVISDFDKTNRLC